MFWRSCGKFVAKQDCQPSFTWPGTVSAFNLGKMPSPTCSTSRISFERLQQNGHGETTLRLKAGCEMPSAVYALTWGVRTHAFSDRAQQMFWHIQCNGPRVAR